MVGEQRVWITHAHVEIGVGVLEGSRLQQKLVTYNAEDCAALERLTECIYALAVKAELPHSAKK